MSQHPAIRSRNEKENMFRKGNRQRCAAWWVTSWKVRQ